MPYCPYLLLKYNAHINVESCASVKSVKYLYKYVYKGHDSTNLAVTVNNDEILKFLEARYVSAHEATWRVFEYHLNEQSHTITRLSVHLENQQQVYFLPGEEAEALKKAELSQSTLTAWFELNKNDFNAHQYFYREIPNYYTFTEKKWKLRTNEATNTIGRMYLVNPNEGERFYLRLLLLHVKGATSFKDLRFHNEIDHKTFKDTFISRGLLKDDKHWDDCLREAIMIQMPYQLRHLFAII